MGGSKYEACFSGQEYDHNSPHWLALVGDNEKLEELLQRDRSCINSQASDCINGLSLQDDSTPLICAVYNSQLDAIKILLRHGAQVNQRAIDEAKSNEIMFALIDATSDQAVLQYLKETTLAFVETASRELEEGDSSGDDEWLKSKPAWFIEQKKERDAMYRRSLPEGIKNARERIARIEGKLQSIQDVSTE